MSMAGWTHHRCDALGSARPLASPGGTVVMTEADRRLPRSPGILYNLAGFESLPGASAGALRHLAESIALNPTYGAPAEEVSDFDSVRTTPAFSR